MTTGKPCCSRKWTYTLAGALISLGAPVGYAVVRTIHSGQISFHWLQGELWSDTLEYLYISISTSVFFSIFGYVLGRQADRLMELAVTDELTGLANMRAFRQRLEEEIERSNRYGTPLSLLVIDLDRLKQINDLHGHRAGDAALSRVARSIREGLRMIDLGARQGGDEFAIIAPNTDESAAVGLAERIRSEIESVSPCSDCPIATVSIGVTTRQSRDEPASLDRFLAAADRALYKAKSLGRNQVATSADPFKPE